MKARIFIFLILALSAYASASRFLIAEVAMSEKIEGLQLYYYNMSDTPGFKFSLGLGFMYLTVKETSDFENGSIFAISPGATVRYLTPVWLMPEASVSLNAGYESYSPYNSDSKSGFILGVTFSQKLFVVPSWKYAPILGAGIFETFNARSKIYPKDIGLAVSLGFKF
ncbi:MAG: hypothetical protein LBR60_07605 [Fibrobacter sp.]|nr:hypothetical protein [Fibrobacter sp.]